MPSPSLGSDYFDRLYARDADPWNFASSPYEAQKYAATVEMLGDTRFRNGLEIGCSIGVLTALLGSRCDRLLAIDINERALAQAATRSAHLANIRFKRMAVPNEFPKGSFDLVVLSEVGYYWSDQDLKRAVDLIAGAASGGILELVHFLPPVADYVRGGDAVHAVFLADPRFERLRARRAERYRIDILRVR